MSLNVSVIICTHNPRPDYLRLVLDALKGQTLPKEQWELLLIDNASNEPLCNAWDLSWHPRARHIREEELGLTPARLRGIHESQSEILVFVDDDNVLSSDYIDTALQIRREMPHMAAFGGKIAGEFEIPPEPWMKPYLPMLALRDIERDYWSNDPMRLGRYPCGAGLCVTRKVVEVYARMLAQDARRKQLGRNGFTLASGEDDDICFTAGQLGYGVGMFARLELTHLIPKERLSEDYLLRLVEGMSHSGYVLAYLWNSPVRPPVHSLRWHFAWWNMRRKMTAREQRFGDAQVRAERRAWETIRAMKNQEQVGK